MKIFLKILLILLFISSYKFVLAEDYFAPFSYEKIGCIENAKFNPVLNSCECEVGYDLIGKICQKDCRYIDLNSFLDYSKKNECTCEPGYINYKGVCKANRELCWTSYGKSSYYNSYTNSCDCISGYGIKNKKCSYISYGYEDIISTNSNKLQDKKCNKGYSLVNGRCEEICDYKYSEFSKCENGKKYKIVTDKKSCYKKEYKKIEISCIDSGYGSYQYTYSKKIKKNKKYVYSYGYGYAYSYGDEKGYSYSLEKQKTNRGNLSFSLLKIDLNKYNIFSETSEKEDCHKNCKADNLKTYIDKLNADIAINANYFCPKDYAACKYNINEPLFMFYSYGNNSIINFDNNNPVFIFDGYGKYEYFDPLLNNEKFTSVDDYEKENKTKITALFSNIPTLIYNGKNVIDVAELEIKQRFTKGTRVGLGIKNNIVYIIFINSATIQDIASIYEKYKVDFAMNLDGGLSTALYMNNKYKIGPGRDIPNAILFKKIGY